MTDAVWVIREPALIDLLRRAHAGEDPDRKSVV